MKKNKNLKRIIQAMTLLVLLVIVVVSCRKDDSDPDPVVPPTDVVPPVIPDQKINMMSAYETSRQLPFPGHKINKLGTGLLGFKFHPYWEGAEFIGEVVWEAFDYLHTEAKFDEIEDQLDDIQDQIEVLNSTIEHLADEMNIDFAKLSSYISSTALNEQIAFVQTAMGGGTYNQLMFYPNVAARYQADSTNIQNQLDMKDLKLHAHGFASNIYNDMSPASMTNVINNMNQLLCPTVGSGDNALTGYAKTILDECKGRVNDSDTAMQVYLMLESYFLKVVNYQFQAATVMVNACNMLDNDGQHGYAATFWDSEMGRIIPEEVDVFLSTVDYLVVNLSEYRNEDRFVNDMQYVSYGIAPDNMFFHVLARSRFLANMLYEASGNPRPVICGSVMVPHIYNVDASRSDMQDPVTVNIGSSTITSEATKYATMIPYTYWDTDQTCHPDNNWDFYNFGTSASDTTWACTPQTIQIVSNSSTSPWPHSLDISWAITPLYYNPSDPTQTSTTRTAECSFQFAYFYTNWQWGYMLLSNTSKMNKLPSPFDLKHYHKYFEKNFPAVPFCGWAHTYDDYNGYQEFKADDKIKFTVADDYTGSLQASGTITNSDLYTIGDSRYVKVKTGSDLPPVNNTTNELEAWGCYNGSLNVNPADYNSPWIFISLAPTHWNSTGNDYFLVGDILLDTLYMKQHNYIFPTRFGNRVSLETGAEYNAGVQYVFFDNEDITNDPFDLKLRSSMQYIYQGFYNRE
ncbi:MAG: hypothetical protein IPH20_02440 [Bacteroidales bacterium]|nr:hypothetical protein [Bacteroidales bacterium]